MGILTYLHSLTTPHRLPTLDLSGISLHLSSPRCQNVVVMVGAGISVNAGIPDFRGMEDGFYERAARKYGELPTPRHLFDLEYFLENPAVFYEFFREEL